MSTIRVSIRVFAIVALRAGEITVFMMMLRNARMIFKSERDVNIEERAIIRSRKFPAFTKPTQQT